MLLVLVMRFLISLKTLGDERMKRVFRLQDDSTSMRALPLAVSLMVSCTFYVGVSASARAQMLTGYDEPEPVASRVVPATEPSKTPQSLLPLPEQQVKTVVGQKTLHEPAPRLIEPKVIPVPEAAQQKVRAPSRSLLTNPYSYGPAFEDVEAAPSYAVTAKPEHVISQVSGSMDPIRQDSPVDFEADSLSYDENAQIVRAHGNVFMEQDGRILRADEVNYSFTDDKVIARGNVVINEPSGDVHLTQYVELTDQLKQGVVEHLTSELQDGSRFTSELGRRKANKTTVMERATYTACEVCESDPEKPPVWQIKASKVTHDAEEKKISYNNARFEVYGVPVAYVPYFSHPDGTIERKSGFLAPSGGFKSNIGAFANGRYYWDIAPDKDLTFGAIAMTRRNPLAYAEWRQRWDDAEIVANVGTTYAEERVAGANDTVVTKDEEWRGHAKIDGLWNIDQKWRAGLDVNWVSDDQYARRYDFSDFEFEDKDVLTNEIYAERFSGRNYATARLLKFQDIRVREEQQEQPEVLPEVIASFKGEPGQIPFIKGSWGVDASFLGLQRGSDAQDVNRASLEGYWQRRLVSDYGLVNEFSMNARGDLYNTREREVALAPGTGQDSETTETRFFPSAHWQTSYPLVRAFDKAQVTLEPIVALTVAPNLDVNNDIPNEDSQDVQIDASNLFESNRFPGFDRIEDKSKITGGFRTGYYDYDGSRYEVFLGQSFRIDEDDNPFPKGSGLDQRESDVVGQISAYHYQGYNVNYRFQYGSRHLNAQRHEVDGSAHWGPYEVSGRYLFAKALEGTDIDESREQVALGLAYNLSEEWRLSTGAVQDLGSQPGLREAFAGVDYFGQCVSFSLVAERNLTDDITGDSETEILFRIGLKNLGEFAASGLRVSSTEE